MTEVEFAEAFSAYLDTSFANMGLYITIISGYLVVAYLAGKDLTRSQLIIVSSLFVVFASIMSLSGFALLERAIELEAQREGGRDALDHAGYFLLVLQFLGILAALKFMMDVRKPN